MKKQLLIGLAGAVAALMIQGCAPTSYKVKSPTPSDLVYSSTQASEAITLSMRDARAEADKNFSFGILKANLLLDGKAINPVVYLKENSIKELNARGINTQEASAGNVDVAVKKLYIRNHRATGFSPFVTLSWFSADVKTAKGNQRMGIFIKRGKVPVWSFDEVIDPTFNEPLSLLVKEFSAKVNRLTANQAISDEQVASLVAAVNAQPAATDAYIKVYQLGFGNNKSAIKSLVGFTKHSDEYIRLAAISSLGILQADSELPLLKTLYAGGTLWQDRAMALKAICDLATPDALAIAKQVKADLDKSGKTDTDTQWLKEILNMYL